jgi:hypothetical protein
LEEKEIDSKGKIVDAIDKTFEEQVRRKTDHRCTDVCLLLLMKYNLNPTPSIASKITVLLILSDL